MQVTMTGGWNGPTYNISREGNVITAAEDTHGMRHMGESYQVALAGDHVEIRGPWGKDKDFDVQLRPDGADVAPPNNGMRGGAEGGFSLRFDTPIKPEQYEQVGLSIASSLIGIPLFLPAA